jgi:lactate dehydrogenase-like 2-hydroxyacid dehydrogenase
MAKRCVGAFNMKVIYHNRHRNLPAEEELKAVSVSFQELLERSDVLSVHTNLSKETLGKFDKAVFEKMKRTSIFINTARGAIHNEQDLINALQNGTIWGAGLDVTNPEPMKKDNPLLTMPNAAVLPHIGSATIETRDEMANIATENVIAALNGKRIPFPVNPEVYD